MDIGWAGGVAGAAIGVIGGVVGGALGTYLSIKHARTTRERSFLTKVAVWMCIGVVGFVVLLLLFPAPYKYFLWIPYVIGLPYSVIILNRRLNQIRREQSHA